MAADRLGRHDVPADRPPVGKPGDPALWRDLAELLDAAGRAAEAAFARRIADAR